MTMPNLRARVQGIRYEATDIWSIRLAPLAQPFPIWTPGSHIDVHLLDGLMRSYSLSNLDPAEPEYRLTIQRDPTSRGGSSWIHDSLRVGQIIDISAPRNNFELVEDATRTIFIAGGIGVTPFLPMARRLTELRRSWTLHYTVRTPDRAAHLEELQHLAAHGCGAVELNIDGVEGGRMLDIGALVGSAGPLAHLYCCGPEGLLNAFRIAAASLPADQIHFEYFSAHVTVADDGGYVVVLDKSGYEITVRAGETILSALLEAGVDQPYSCQNGICGACEVRVLSGVPDHRDMLLSEKERAENKTMMVCCSGSKTDRLVLDL